MHAGQVAPECLGRSPSSLLLRDPADGQQPVRAAEHLRNRNGSGFSEPAQPVRLGSEGRRCCCCAPSAGGLDENHAPIRQGCAIVADSVLAADRFSFPHDGASQPFQRSAQIRLHRGRLPCPLPAVA